MTDSMPCPNPACGSKNTHVVRVKRDCPNCQGSSRGCMFCEGKSDTKGKIWVNTIRCSDCGWEA